MGVGNTLQQLLEESGSNVNEVAQATGVSPSTLYSIIRRDSMSANIEDLYKVAHYLGVSLDYFYVKIRYEKEDLPLSTEERELVKKYRQLTEEEMLFVKTALDFALNKPVKTIVKFPQRAPDREEQPEPKSNTIDFPDMATVKISEQPAAAGSGVYLGPESFTEYMVQDNDLIRRTAFAVPVSGDSMEPKFHDGDIALVNFEPAEIGDIIVVTMDGLGYIKKLGDGVLISLNQKYKPIPMKEDMRVNGKVIGILDPEWF